MQIFLLFLFSQYFTELKVLKCSLKCSFLFILFFRYFVICDNHLKAKKSKFCNHLLNLMLIQTCMLLFLMWKTEDLLVLVHIIEIKGNQNGLVSNIL